MKTERYLHHGDFVSVRTDLKGKHKEYSLCSSCVDFKPGTKNHCPIADEVHQSRVKFNIVTPIWECPNYFAQEKKVNPERWSA